RRNAGHILDDSLDRLRDALDLAQVVAGDLDSEWALDAGGEHIDPVADRRDPDIGKARQAHDAIELLDQLFRGHARAPFTLRLELDRRLDHFQRSRIGCGLRAADLAEYGCHFRYGRYELVGLLQN